MNYFGALKAAVDTPFVLAFLGLFCSLALTNVSYVSLMDLGVSRSFQQRCWNFCCFHFGFLWHSLTIHARYQPVINKKICFDVEAFLWIGNIRMGYWPSVRSRWLDIGQVIFFACLWTETKSRSITRKKRTRPISSHLDRTNLVKKGFIIWLLRKFCSRDTAGSPERARWLHLARSGSQSQRVIWFILPARGASHIIKHVSIYHTSEKCFLRALIG